MSEIAIQIILISTLIILNGYFSLSEIALLSVKKSRLRHLAKQGNTKASNALFLTRHSSEMLSTIQIGITMIGIFAGAFGGATVAEYVQEWLVAFPLFAEYSESLSVAIVVFIITFFSLVIGELVPKQIALSNPEKLSLIVAGSIKIIMKMSAPLVKVLSVSTAGFLKLFRIVPASEQVVTEEEIKLLIAEGAESGVFERSEQKMVESVFHLGNRPIKDFMTHSHEVVWLDIRDPLETIRKKIRGSNKSVFPICDGSLDATVGAIEAKDVLNHLFETEKELINIGSLIQPVMTINADVPSLVAIDRLKKSSVSIVLITSKTSQKVLGIISFHDILEALVGEFHGDSKT
ncbi:MAG: HlyC/CorC family transporter [Candidatus Magasanikbacteria bacterium]|jgi:putative hemolysin|nr:HlyC/CorC family transporter [Candidatus Magasanikbacteria bacterium]